MPQNLATEFQELVFATSETFGVVGTEQLVGTGQLVLVLEATTVGTEAVGVAEIELVEFGVGAEIEVALEVAGKVDIAFEAVDIALEAE